jgi:GNAT superfamily N-acetyltransferase
MHVSLVTAHLDDPTVVALTTASVAEMAGLYGGRPGSGPAPRREEFEPPAGAFLLATRKGEAIGCGGLSRFDDTTAEIRRMYVAPEARGEGVARRLLAGLLDRARAAGYERVRLETGNAQLAAIGLYVDSGFEPIPCWGPYATDERSVCLELEL